MTETTSGFSVVVQLTRNRQRWLVKCGKGVYEKSSPSMVKACHPFFFFGFRLDSGKFSSYTLLRPCPIPFAAVILA